MFGKCMTGLKGLCCPKGLVYDKEYHTKKMAEMRSSSGLLSGTSVPVYMASKIVVITLVIFTIVATDMATLLFSAVNSWILGVFKWWYIGIVASVLIYAFWMMLSRYGNIRLGDQNGKPDYSYSSWFAMLFGCGMGIGLIFWSIAEPIYHFQSNPWIGGETGIEPMSAAAAEEAMLLTFFHWGLHPWAIYAVVALALSYFAYRKNLPLSIRSTVYPIFGEKIYGPLGHTVDVLSILGTLFGVATSLGLGAQQLAAGIDMFFGIDVFLNADGSPNTAATSSLIALVTLAATISVVSGLDKGIKLLSNLNLWLSIAIMVFFLVWGPTAYILNTFLQATGNYLGNIIPLSFWTNSNVGEGGDWQLSWTVFYWGWWIAWAPFVGMFIARISRGRTIREFIIGVLLVPTLFGFVWLTLFGGTALNIELFNGGGIVEAVSNGTEGALFATISSMEIYGQVFAQFITKLFSLIALVLIVTYFITSSDSGTLVINTIMSVGDENPPISHRVTWGVYEGLVAIALLLAGGLGAMQTASIAAALPFSVVMLLMMISLVKAIREEHVIV